MSWKDFGSKDLTVNDCWVIWSQFGNVWYAFESVCSYGASWFLPGPLRDVLLPSGFEDLNLGFWQVLLKGPKYWANTRFMIQGLGFKGKP